MADGVVLDVPVVIVAEHELEVLQRIEVLVFSRSCEQVLFIVCGLYFCRHCQKLIHRFRDFAAGVLLHPVLPDLVHPDGLLARQGQRDDLSVLGQLSFGRSALLKDLGKARHLRKIGRVVTDKESLIVEGLHGRIVLGCEQNHIGLSCLGRAEAFGQLVLQISCERHLIVDVIGLVDVLFIGIFVVIRLHRDIVPAGVKHLDRAVVIAAAAVPAADQ